jgi:hypothetical protein
MRSAFLHTIDTFTTSNSTSDHLKTAKINRPGGCENTPGPGTGEHTPMHAQGIHNPRITTVHACLGRAVHDLRTHRELSHEQLGHRIHAHACYIRALEHGRANPAFPSCSISPTPSTSRSPGSSASTSTTSPRTPAAPTPRWSTNSRRTGSPRPFRSARRRHSPRGLDYLQDLAHIYILISKYGLHNWCRQLACPALGSIHVHPCVRPAHPNSASDMRGPCARRCGRPKRRRSRCFAGTRPYAARSPTHDRSESRCADDGHRGPDRSVARC